ncbi:DUF6875 domain-containing protein [Nostoc sp.]|uniref:DUF6875 domain-containing protein n=1 Tax=Nostoc sp. TaxID=1180 RepID=UPI002FFB70CB
MKLYTTLEIEQLQQNEDLPYLIEIMDWVKIFLARPHPDLGRRGVVCPFVPSSLKSNNIWLAVIHTKNLCLEQVEAIVKSYLDIFLKKEADDDDKELAISKAFVLIFPDVHIEEASKVIDGVQKKLKPMFVESGLMLGEFHNRTENPGLHNPNFRPLRSPIPLLVIRPMTEIDLTFLMSPDNPHLCIRYLEAYLNHFGHKITDEIKFKDAHQALALAKEQLKQENLVNYCNINQSGSLK